MVPNTRISNCSAVLASNQGTNSMKAYTAAQLRTYSTNTFEELPGDYSVDPWDAKNGNYSVCFCRKGYLHALLLLSPPHTKLLESLLIPLPTNQPRLAGRRGGRASLNLTIPPPLVLGEGGGGK
jgi:hypothetical protein